jgi:hypothetical protein
MRQILNLIVLMMMTLGGFAQIEKRDFIFDWQNNKDIIWISIDSTYIKFTPSIDEVLLAKEISIKYIDSLEKVRDPKIKKHYGKILNSNHKDYYRQYVGYIDKEGNRVIFINAGCSASGENKNLDRIWIFVLDGGSCYFQIRIDIKKKKCIHFNVNGDA